MITQAVKLIDPSRNVLAIAQVTEEENRFGGTIDLKGAPSSLRALFEEFEEIVSGQMFSFLDDIEAKIDSLAVKAVFDNGRELPIKNLQVFPSTRDISFQLAEVRSPIRTSVGSPAETGLNANGTV